MSKLIYNHVLTYSEFICSTVYLARWRKWRFCVRKESNILILRRDKRLRLEGERLGVITWEKDAADGNN